MVKASDLIKQQKEREDRKYITYDKIHTHIDKKITLASSANFYYTWYQIPEILIGMPTYNLNDCLKYLKEILIKDGFIITFYDPNILYISWFPTN
jgi:hypothetical protein